MANNSAKIVRTATGKAVQNQSVTRQPIITQQGTGLGGANQPKAPVAAIRNAFQRQRGF